MMIKSLSLAAAVAMVSQSASGFTFGDMERRRITSTSLQVSPSADVDSRRDFFNKIGTAAVAGAGMGFGVLTPDPANAAKIDNVNAKLKAYGLLPVNNLPNGFSPLLETWGKGKNRFPLLIQFNHPSTWVVTLPNNNVNGEDGTVQAGEYAKGDTATLFVYEGEGHVDNIASKPKTFFEDVLIKAISQKGANVYQNFKVTKVVPQTGPEYGGKDYVICDFRYELLTGAGFEVDRRGVAAITSEGKAVEVLWTATIRQRYPKTEEALRDIASSFRVNADGLNFSDQLFTFVEKS